MIIITYWHDDDEDTITSLTCETDKECEAICKVLQEYKMTIISVDNVPTPTTAEELEEMFKDIYED